MINRISNQSRTAGFLTLLLSTTLAVAQAGLDTGPWPMFHRSPDHVAYTPNELPSTGAINWSAALSDTVEYSSPVIASNGTIVVGDQGKEVWSFNLQGVPLWNYHTGGNLRYNSAAILADRTVVIGSADGRLYGLTPTGRLAWVFIAGGPIKTSPAVAPDGTIYVGADDGKLYALNPNGSLRWSYSAPDTIRSSPAIGSDGTVYFGCHDGILRALWPSGALRWVGATGGPIRTAPAYRNGEVVIGSADGFVYAISEAGVLQWATFADLNLRSSPSIGSTGKIYLGVDTKIACFHDNGDPSFEFETGSRVLGSPAVTTDVDGVDVVICGSDNGFVYALKAGSVRWMTNLGAPVRSSPAIGGNGLVYVAAMNGFLYALGIPDLTSVGSDASASAGPRLVLAGNPSRSDSDLSIWVDGATLQGGSDPVPLSILDASGRLVRSLAIPRSGVALWDGRDATGRRTPAGVYFARAALLGNSTGVTITRTR